MNSRAPRQSLFRGFTSIGSEEIKANTLVALGNIKFAIDGISFRWCPAWNHSIEESDAPENHVVIYLDWDQVFH
jgi:hypothetical protein